MNDPIQPQTIEVTTKPRAVVILEGSLYVVISAIPPAVTVLQSEQVLDTRTITALTLSCIVAGAIALKAFLSQSMSTKQPP